MRIASISTGFIEVPKEITLNIYAQGCKLRCEGCHNAQIRDFDGGEELSVEAMAKLLNAYPMVTCVCWLGGDATYQPEELCKFNTLFKKMNLSVALYTGRVFSDVYDLLKDVDLVIDGEWKGIPVTDATSNQKVYKRYAELWKNISWEELKEEGPR